MRKFELIKVKADTPYERGVQYGEQARDKIWGSIEYYQRLFAKTSNMSWNSIKQNALSYVPIIEENLPEIMEEARGISVGAGASLDDIMILNCRYEITKFPQSNECTSFSILPEASAGRKTYVGQNWDYRVGILDNIVILHIEESNGIRILGLAEAGQVIRNGFNNCGVGLCANNLQSIHDNRNLGIPVTFLRRKVLSSKTYDEAKELLINAKRSVSCNFMLGSAEGKAIDLETSPKGVDAIEPVDGIITHANHFVVQPENDVLETSPRDNRLNQLLREKHGSIDVEHIIKSLSDHENYPKAICRHPSDVSIDAEMRSITVAGIIYDLVEEKAYISAGPPCEEEFYTYKL